MEPGEIKKLDEVVVNRIAAGEIIQRPANALKELLENSLDAKSTNIQIVVKSGGLKYLQIQDNGTGIRKDDLEIVCERFTTSKLTTFEDLSTMTTYGFRGEALSSISHVAHLTIQTKTRNEKCAYKASYADGKLIGGNIQPIAGNQGTQITIEDLFYNTPQRKAALKSPAEELQRITDVLSKYAIHNSHVAITLKKYGENNILKTISNSNVIENIRIVYGKQIAKELLEPMITFNDAELQMKMIGYITKPNYSSKKGIFLLFVNHRLVDSPKLLSQINDVYSVYLPKGNHPFVYISLEMATQNVDVNVHPTKHEVHFMYEDEIIEKIKETLAAQLLGCNESRTFYTQTRLLSQSQTKSNVGKKVGKSNDNNSDDEDSNADDDDDDMNINNNNVLKSNNVYAKNMIRTDFKEQKLEKFFGQTILIPSQSKTKLNLNDNVVNDDDTNNLNDEDDDIKIDPQNEIKLEKITSPSIAFNKIYKIPEIIIRKKTRLTSILNMRKGLEQKTHRGLRKLLSEFTFVGIVDPQSALIQFETKLYLCDTQLLCEELFYQILLYEFENFGKITFDPPLPVYNLAMLALRNADSSGWTSDDGPIEELSERIKEILIEKSALLKQYYNLCITSDGLLESIPLLLDKHKPFMGYLPMYILRLSTEVDWNVEENCFTTFSRETAKFYSKISKFNNCNRTVTVPEQNKESRIEKDDEKWKWTTEYCIYPAIKKYLLPQHGIMVKKGILQIANLSELYKVFERC